MNLLTSGSSSLSNFREEYSLRNDGTPRCGSIEEVREEFIIKHFRVLNSLFKLVDFLQLGSTVNIEAFTCTPKDLRKNLLSNTVENIRSSICACMSQTDSRNSSTAESRAATDLDGAKRGMMPASSLAILSLPHSPSIFCC
jgi:hypothetical protein